MSEAASAVPASAETRVQNRITELKVSGHLMTLDTGLFCLFQSPPDGGTRDGSGLPGVRISLPPTGNGRKDAVAISTFREDGWLGTRDDAALVRIGSGPAQILVTIYQSPAHATETAPRLQVLRLSPDSQSPALLPQVRAPAPPAAPTAVPPAQQPVLPGQAEMVAHVQRAGDVAGKLGDWIGTRGSRSWIEGFGIAPKSGLAPADIEYQAVLGRGWLSPWVEGGKFCGSRGMALPLLGLKLRLRGAAAEAYACSYEASFVDGSSVGPVPAGQAVEAESLAPLEAFRIVIASKARLGVEPASTVTRLVAASAPARPSAAKPSKQPVAATRKSAASKRR